MIIKALRHFLRNERGNISVTFALTLIPVLGLIGAGVDYSMLASRKATLDALADSASLAAVTPTMLGQSGTVSVSTATLLFTSQSSSIKGIGAVALTVTPVDNGLKRTVTVSYSTTSKTMFGGFVGLSTVALTGTSTATASVPPNIDFYLLLDNSPSMAIAATTAGINTMVANTPDQCAFGCHESDTSPNDYYGLARRLGVPLRMDLVTKATQNLLTTAKSTAVSTNATYRAAIYTFNIGFNTITPLTSNLATAASQAANIQLYQVPYQNWNNDAITDYTDAMTSINKIMPAPGTGTNQRNDTPQEVLFIVTDGVQDQNVNGNRVQSQMSNSYCTTVKNRGIRVAVLYTTYLPLPTNDWYNQYIASFQPNIGANLQSCASSGLYFQVSTDQDISAAMVTIFNTALATAHLAR